MKSALVVAHPDDEILWFSSILGWVDHIVICFLDVPSRSDWTQGRRQAAERFPLPNAEFLGITESEAFNAADWNHPRETEYGLEVRHRDDTLPGFDGQQYRDNYQRLRRELGSRLKGYRRVFTHNPWGEYGHEEHVQLYRAVKSLQAELGFELLFSNYCSNRSYPLMLRYLRGFTSDYETAETDPQLAKRIEQLYRQCGCWTWPFDDYAWFTHECFMRDMLSVNPSVTSGHAFPLNFIKLDSRTGADAHRGSAHRLLEAASKPLAAIRRRFA